jgi:hypothetical protein
MMPARYSKNGIALSNQYINVNHPSEIHKYQAYDRYKKQYYNYIKENALRRNGSNLINSKSYYRKNSV